MGGGMTSTRDALATRMSALREVRAAETSDAEDVSRATADELARRIGIPMSIILSDGTPYSIRPAVGEGPAVLGLYRDDRPVGTPAAVDRTATSDVRLAFDREAGEVALALIEQKRQVLDANRLPEAVAAGSELLNATKGEVDKIVGALVDSGFRSEVAIQDRRYRLVDVGEGDRALSVRTSSTDAAIFGVGTPFDGMAAATPQQQQQLFADGANVLSRVRAQLDVRGSSETRLTSATKEALATAGKVIDALAAVASAAEQPLTRAADGWYLSITPDSRAGGRFSPDVQIVRERDQEVLAFNSADLTRNPGTRQATLNSALCVDAAPFLAGVLPDLAEAVINDRRLSAASANEPLPGRVVELLELRDEVQRQVAGAGAIADDLRKTLGRSFLPTVAAGKRYSATGAGVLVDPLEGTRDPYYIRRVRESLPGAGSVEASPAEALEFLQAYPKIRRANFMKPLSVADAAVRAGVTLRVPAPVDRGIS